MSCLPTFAQPYRLLCTETVEAFLSGRTDDAGIERHRDLLQGYRRAWEQNAPQIVKITGLYFGSVGDVPAQEGLLGALRQEWGCLRRAGMELLERFGEAMLGRYRIHDWARVARASVDPLRKVAICESG